MPVPKTSTGGASAVRSALLLATGSLFAVACGSGGSKGSSGGGQGPPASLAFALVPGQAPPCAPIAPGFQVRLLDAAGTLDTKTAATISVALGVAPAGGTLSGTLSMPVTGGIAMFDNVVVSGPSGTYSLQASAAGVPSASSSPLGLDSTPTHLVVTSLAPSSLTPFQAFDVTVELRTAGDKLAGCATDAVTLSLSGGGNDLYWHAKAGANHVAELIDPATASVVRSMSTNGPSALFGLVYDPRIGLVRLSGLLGAHLLSDPATGDEVLYRGTTGSFGPGVNDRRKGWLVDGGGVMHTAGPYNFNSVHYTVDPVTGTETLVGSFSMAGFSVQGVMGLARHPSTGVVYGIVKTASGPASARRLATLNLATGVFTDIGNIGGDFSGLTFSPSGVLYTATGMGGAVKQRLHTLNLTTAAATQGMSLSNGAGGPLVVFVPPRLGGTTVVNAVSGVATFRGIQLDQPGTGYVLGAASGALASASSPAYTVAGAATPGGVLQWQSASGTVSENVAGGQALVTLSLSAAQPHSIPVMISIDAASTALVGGTTADTMQPGAFEVLFPAGATTFTFPIPIVDDAIAEGNETLLLTIRSARLAGSIGAQATLTLTIQSNE